MAAGLAQAWSFTANQEPDTVAACRVLGGLTADDARAVAAALTHLGRLDNQIAKANRNKSLSWDFLTAQPAALAGFVAGVTPPNLHARWLTSRRVPASSAPFKITAYAPNSPWASN